MAGWLEWAPAHFLVSAATEKVSSDKAPWTVGRDRLFPAVTGCAGQAHYRSSAWATGLRVRLMHTQQRSVSTT